MTTNTTSQAADSGVKVHTENNGTCTGAPCSRSPPAWAIAHCDQWAILSAKHGLIDPDKVIEPYDVTLSTMRQRPECALRLARGYT